MNKGQDTHDCSRAIKADILSNMVTDCAADMLGSFLSTENKSTLTLLSKGLHGFFHTQKMVTALLSYVAKGRQDKVEQMPSPRLLLDKADVTDCSARTFKNISAYQYALWALDRHMVREIEKTARDAKGLEGDSIRAALLVQRQELQDEGLSYELDGVLQPKAVAYDPQPLFDAYQFYLDSYDGLAATRQWKQIDNLWYALGKQQRLMPVHAIHEMLTPQRSFYPAPTFTEETLQRTFNLFNYVQNRNELLNLNELGINFSLLRGCGHHGAAGGVAGGCGMMHFAATDLAALKTLLAVRTMELRLAPDLTPNRSNHACC
ncbi:MAG: hypothetical protein ACHP65_08570 [Legionellales bacterium]